MDKQISVEEAIKYLCMIPIPFISGNRDCDAEESQKYSIALSMAIKALETSEEFEKAQIITGGRLNGRAHVYKCGLEDGKRKALEQEPCDNAVSRQAVKEQMIKYGFHAPDMTVTEFVEDLPPVTPQPKTGHWIYRGQDIYECSECGENHHGNYGTFYCEKCGTRMR